MPLCPRCLELVWGAFYTLSIYSFASIFAIIGAFWKWGGMDYLHLEISRNPRKYESTYLDKSSEWCHQNIHLYIFFSLNFLSLSSWREIIVIVWSYKGKYYWSIENKEALLVWKICNDRTIIPVSNFTTVEWRHSRFFIYFYRRSAIW